MAIGWEGEVREVKEVQKLANLSIPLFYVRTQDYMQD